MRRAPAPNPLTVRTLVAAFMEHAKATYQKRAGSSSVTNFRDSTRALQDIYADLPARELTDLQLQAVRQYLIEQGLARRTINDRVRQIRQIWRWAVGERWLVPECLAALESVKGLRRFRSPAPDPTRKQPVDVALLEWAIRAASPVIGDMLNFQWLTGARPGEVCGVKGCDLVMRDGPWFYDPPHHKMSWLDRPRRIVLGPQAIEIARRRFSLSYLFTSDRFGKPYTEGSYYLNVRRLCEAHGKPAFCVQQIRKRAATDADERAGAETAQELLGHGDIRTTERYIGRRALHVERYAARFG